MINPYQILYYAILVFPVLIFVIVFAVLLNDNRIHAFIINRNHDVRRKKVNPNMEYFRDRDSIYMIPSDCVTLSSTERGLNPRSELFYVEDNPLPINFKPVQKDADGNEVTIDSTVWLVNKMVLENVLTSTSKPKSEFFNLIIGYLSEPKKLITLVIVGIIIAAMVKPTFVSDLVEAFPR